MRGPTDSLRPTVPQRLAAGIQRVERLESDRGHDDSCREYDSAIDRLDNGTYLVSSNWSTRVRSSDVAGTQPSSGVDHELRRPVRHRRTPRTTHQTNRE